jgi:hypothetical protein
MVKLCEDEKAENPEGVIIDYENDFVYYSKIEGRLFVDGCPCNGLTRYEDWIWNNRQEIRDYLKKRVEREHEWAQQELTLNKIAGISK